VTEKIAFAMGLITFVAGFISYWISNRVRELSFERDFNHLKRNFEALSDSVAINTKVIDDQLGRQESLLLEVKSLLQVMNFTKK
jgi:hypothetical protein